MELLSFTDDTAILLSESMVDILYYEVNEMLNTNYAQFCKNLLKCNLIKSKFICFEPQELNILIKNNLIVHSLKRNKNVNTTCDLKYSILEKVKEIILWLGIIIDNRLKWVGHINIY